MTMTTLLLLLVTVAAVQCEVYEVREQRNIQEKLNTILQYLTKTRSELGIINKSDEKEFQNAVEDFRFDIINHSNDKIPKGVKDNTHKNEYGKKLFEILDGNKELVELAQSDLTGDTGRLQANLKIALEKHRQLVKDVFEANLHIKDSTVNTDRASYHLIDYFDVSSYMIKKFYYHLEFRKYTNKELRKNINEVLEQALESLDQIPVASYSKSELVLHSSHLSSLVKDIISRINTWLQQPHSKQSELRLIAEQTVAELGEIIAGIQRHGNSNSSFDNLILMYKLWLRRITGSISNLDVLSKDRPDGIVRATLFDAVGITMYHKTIFALLAGNGH